MTTIHEKTCRLITREFNPVKGSTCACEGCGTERLFRDLSTIPKQCWNSTCRAVFQFCERGFPHGLLEQSQELVERGYGYPISAEA